MLCPSTRTIFVASLALLATASQAVELSETFPDPLGGWTNRWLYQNSNLSNYFYAAGISSNQDFRYAGNNPISGLWYATTKGFNSMGTPGPTASIQFDPIFAAATTRLQMEFAFFPVGTDVAVKDLLGNTILSHTVTRAAGQSPTDWVMDVTSVTGISSIDMTTVPYQGVSVLGNVYIVQANATSAVPEPASLGALGLGAVALMRRRRSAK